MRSLIAHSSLCLILALACRTTDDNTQAKQEPPAEISGGKTVLLKKVVGGLTKDYPESRYSECLIYREDMTNSEAILKDLEELKTQRLQEGFIFRPQIPSVQFYGYLGKEPILLQEIGAEKAQYLMPQDANAPGNPKLALIMETFKEKCEDAR